MKVVNVVPSIAQECAGTSYTISMFSYGLSVNGVDVSLHVLDDIPSSLSVAPYKIKNYRRKDNLNLGYSPDMYRGLKMSCQTADVIHNNGLWMMPNVYPYWASRGTTCKLVVQPHGALAPWAMNHSKWKKKVFWWLCQKKVLKNADMFVATAEKEYQEIRSLGFRQPVAIVPIGMDIQKGHTLVDKLDSNRIKRIVFFGRIHKVKAINNLVRAWEELYPSLPQWELVIAGPDCGAKDELDRIIKEYNIPRVRFVGELNGQAKYDFLTDADIYVLPSHTENFGVTVAEALACGTPVIASQGTPWQGVEREQCGRWIPIGVDPLVRTLKDMTNFTDVDRITMGLRGREWIKRDFSWQGIGAKMKAAYAWLLGQGEKPDWVMDS